MKDKEIKKHVKQRYSGIAKRGTSCCCSSSECGTSFKDQAKVIGYSDEDIKKIPEEANMGLGCGNPVALASLNEGETVLDLGSGGGMDVFLASKKVGSKGKIIGLDMTPEMIQQSVENVKRIGVA